MAQRQLYSGLDLYDWRGTGPNGRTKAVDVEKWQQNQEDIRHLPGAFPVQSVVITDGQITPTAAALSVDTEGGAPADDLTAIAPGDLHAGMLLALCSVDAGRKVTIKNSAGASGIQTLDGKDVVLDTQYAVMLRLVSTEILTLWREEPGPLRLQLTVSTPDKLGGVKVQTGDDDGLEMIGDKLRVRQANSTQRGSVLASETAQAGAVPLGGADGVIDKGWIPVMLPNSRLVITESNAAWTPPITGWSRVTVIGGGGAGTSWLAGSGVQLAWGNPGGDTKFGTITARGGATSRALPNSATISGRYRVGGGCAGEVKTEYIYLDKSSPVKITIGAGGIAGAGTSTSGYTGNPGTDTKNDAVSASAQQAWGGNGGRTGYGYGGGGGACGLTWGAESTPCNPHSPGYGQDGGKNAVDAASIPLMGGNGGQGAVIIEYYDPEKEDA